SSSSSTSPASPRSSSTPSPPPARPSHSKSGVERAASSWHGRPARAERRESEMTGPAKTLSISSHPHGRDARATGKRASPRRTLNRFQLLIECADERDQREMYEQL